MQRRLAIKEGKKKKKKKKRPRPGSVTGMDHGAPGSYLTLSPGTDVVSSDGETVGKVEHVLADEGTEIFDGLVIDVRLGPGGLRFVDAPEVDEIFERAVVLRSPPRRSIGCTSPPPRRA